MVADLNSSKQKSGTLQKIAKLQQNKKRKQHVTTISLFSQQELVKLTKQEEF